MGPNILLNICEYTWEMVEKRREGNLSAWETRGVELITGTCLEMRRMCSAMCICGNTLGHEGMTLQGGALLPETPLLKEGKDI